MDDDAPFADRVRARVGATAPGDVVTYGEVAAEAGAPGAARAVGNVLARSDDLPWWRVVAADGRLAPGKEGDQARRLAAEGVVVDASTGRVAGMAGRRRGARPTGSSPPVAAGCGPVGTDRAGRLVATDEGSGGSTPG